MQGIMQGNNFLHPASLCRFVVRKMSNSKFRQDLPPPGGYKPIQYLRIPAKTYFSGVQMFVGYAIFQTFAFYMCYLSVRRAKKLEREERNTRIATMPMMLAEKDRLFLRQLRKNRDDERELMKDVEGWKVGHYWGESIYQTRPENEFPPYVSMNDYMVHDSNFNMRFNWYFQAWF